VRFLPLLLVALAACAHGPDALEPTAEAADEESYSLLTASVASPEARRPRTDASRCDDPARAVVVPAMAYGTYHPPTPGSIKAWRALLGADGDLTRSEQHRILELAVHMGPPGADLSKETKRALKDRWREDGAIDEVLIGATIDVPVCPEEVVLVGARLGLGTIEDPGDVEAVREIAAMLVATYGPLDDVPDLAWHSALHSLEAMQMGRKIKELFESPDNEIDTVDSNL